VNPHTGPFEGRGEVKRGEYLDQNIGVPREDYQEQTRGEQQNWTRANVVRQLWDELPQSNLSPDPSSPVGDHPTAPSFCGEMKTKLERSRQSARECRARKKLRYQYLDEIILEREKANDALRDKLAKYVNWCHQLDKGLIPEGLTEAIHEKEDQANE